jgi:guanylate kinase
VNAVQNAGKICLLDVDIKGVRTIKQSTLKPYYIFVEPQSIEALKKRLQKM